MKNFELQEDDHRFIEIARTVARRALKEMPLTPRQIIGLGNALYALERLPQTTVGVQVEFGTIVTKYPYVAREGDFRYITFMIDESTIGVSIGGHVDYGCGGDSYSEPGWEIDVSGYKEVGCDLINLEDEVEEHFRCKAKISVEDNSSIDYEEYD